MLAHRRAVTLATLVALAVVLTKAFSSARFTYGALTPVLTNTATTTLFTDVEPSTVRALVSLTFGFVTHITFKTGFESAT